MNFFMHIFQGFFQVITCAFSRNHLMGVSCFNGGVCFSDGHGDSFLSGGPPHRGASVLVWGGGFEKNRKIGGVPPPPYGKP